MCRIAMQIASVLDVNADHGGLLMRFLTCHIGTNAK